MVRPGEPGGAYTAKCGMCEAAVLLYFLVWLGAISKGIILGETYWDHHR